MAGLGGQPVDEPLGQEPRFSYLLKQVERAGRGALDRVARHHSITAAQYTALSVLARHPGMSSAQLGRRSFASPQSANELVVALERRRLVTRRASTANRRILGIYLTPFGGEVLAACDAEVAAMELRMLRLLDPAERELMRDLLERCLHGLLHEPGPRPADPPSPEPAWR
jgi:DNA-binding MarR family transcriptional regulator